MASKPPIVSVVAPDNLGPDFVANETDKVYEINVDGTTIARNTDGKLAATSVNLIQDGKFLQIIPPTGTATLVNVKSGQYDVVDIADAFGTVIGHAFSR